MMTMMMMMVKTTSWANSKTYPLCIFVEAGIPIQFGSDFCVCVCVCVCESECVRACVCV